MELLDRIAERQRDQAAQIAERRKQIISRLVVADDGDTKLIDDVDAFVRDCGLPPQQIIDEIRKAVEAGKRRLQNKSIAARATDLKKEQATIQRKLNEANAKLEAAHEQFAIETFPLNERLAELEGELTQSERAEVELIHTCDDQRLINEKSQIESELLELEKTRTQLANKASSKRYDISCLMRQAEAEKGTAGNVRQSRVPVMESELLAINERHASIEKQISTLEDKRKKLLAKMRNA